MNELFNSPKQPTFETIKKIDEKGEYWSARELSVILEYSQYDKFKPTTLKAIEACKNSGQQTKDHFAYMSKMVKIGSNADKELDDIRLSRYACYLIVQNADPEKSVVALGQTYFAVQTRLQEIQQMDKYNSLQGEDERRLFLRKELSGHNKQLMSTAKNAGVVDPIDYAIFNNFGYKGLYGGLDKNGIQRRKGLTKNSNILDHMGSAELAANLFKATQAEEKLKKNEIKGKNEANKTYFEVGQKVRNAIKQIGGTMPEELPIAENIKKIESKINKKLPPK